MLSGSALRKTPNSRAGDPELEDPDLRSSDSSSAAPERLVSAQEEAGGSRSSVALAAFVGLLLINFWN